MLHAVRACAVEPVVEVSGLLHGTLLLTVYIVTFPGGHMPAHSGVVDNGSVCCRDYASTDTSVYAARTASTDTSVYAARTASTDTRVYAAATTQAPTQASMLPEPQAPTQVSRTVLGLYILTHTTHRQARHTLKSGTGRQRLACIHGMNILPKTK